MTKHFIRFGNTFQHKRPIKIGKAALEEIKQLLITDGGVLCCSFVPGPLGDTILVPLLPPSLQTFALNKSHDIISAGHQGVQKTLERLRH